MEVPVKVKLEVPDSDDCNRYLDLSFSHVSGSTIVHPMAMLSGVTVKQDPLSQHWIKNEVKPSSDIAATGQCANIESSSRFLMNSVCLSGKTKFSPIGVGKKGLKSVCRPLIHILAEQLCSRSNSAMVNVPADLCKTVKLLVQDASDDYAVVQFLIGQLHGYCCQKPKTSEMNIMRCLLLYLKKPKSYSRLRKCKLLSLPSRNTLKRYIGYTTIENEVPALVQQRLNMEVDRLRRNLTVASLVIEGTIVRVSAQRRDLIGWMDNIFGEVNTKFGNSSEMLPLYLLGFSLQGPFMDRDIPVAFYLINNLTPSLIHIYTLHILRFTQKLGIRVLRIQGNDTSECHEALRQICGGRMRSRIPHPIDRSNALHVAFDPSVGIKKLRLCFLSEHRQLLNNGRAITASPLKDFFLEQKSRNSRDKRFPTKKHLFPSDFEKNSVKQAIKIFSVRARKTLTVAAQYSKGGDVTATVKFMRFMEKWFRVHDTLHSLCTSGKGNNSSNQHSSAFAGYSIMWLVSKFLRYLETWKRSCKSELHYLDRETYEVLMVTTQTTVKFFRYLLDKDILNSKTGHFPVGAIEQVEEAFLKMHNDASMQHFINIEPDWETLLSPQSTTGPDVCISSASSDSSSTGLKSSQETGSPGKAAKCSTLASIRRQDRYTKGSKTITCTARKTNSDMSLLKRYLAVVNEHREILDIPVSELDEHLCQFIWNVRRKDGQEFKPHSLRCILSSVNRYLASSQYGHTLFNDGPNSRFPKTKDALVRKQGELRRAGRRNKSPRACRLKAGEIDWLYTSGTLSISSPQALLNIVFFHNNEQFGLEVFEHYQLRWGDVQLLTDSEGNQYLECSKKGSRPTICHKQGDPERDPVTAYKAYANQRPSSVLSPDSPFYLTVNSLSYPRHLSWYRPVKMARSKILKMLQTVYQGATQAPWKKNRQLGKC